MNTTSPASEIIEKLKTELELYQAMVALSRQEKLLVASPDAAREMLPLLEKKQNLLTQIAGIEQELLPVKQNWKTNALIETDEKNLIAALLADIGKQLEGLIANEISMERQMHTLNPSTAAAAAPVQPVNSGMGALAQAAYRRK